VTQPAQIAAFCRELDADERARVLRGIESAFPRTRWIWFAADTSARACGTPAPSGARFCHACGRPL